MKSRHVKLFDNGVSNLLHKFYQEVEKSCNPVKAPPPGEEKDFARQVNKCYQGLEKKINVEKLVIDMAVNKALKGAEE